MIPRPHKKAILVLAGLAGLCVVLWALSVARSETKTWGVLLSALPDRVSTKNITNSVYYILKQTHESVFRKDDGQNFTSKVLSSWSRSAGSSRYVLCPDTSLRFDASRPFSMGYFGAYLRAVTAGYDPAARVTNTGRCFVVTFKRGRAGYMDFLSQYENAPTVDNGACQLGLGAYRVSEISKDKITLARKEPVAHGYNEIVLYDYKGVKDPHLNDKRIKDFNRIAPFDVPEHVKKDFLSFDNLGLKSEVLLINVEDKKVREILYNCLDVDAFRRAYFPMKQSFYNIQTVFPLGIPGARAGLPYQDRSFCRGQNSAGPIVLANWRKDNIRQINKFAADLRKKTGINIKVVNYDANALAASLNTRPRAYDLLVIMLSAMRAEQLDFLSSFAGKGSYLDYDVSGANAEYEALLHEDVYGPRGQLAEGLANKLAEQYAVLTLYQGNDTVYYPKEIKNLVVGSELMEYPEVADFRW